MTRRLRLVARTAVAAPRNLPRWLAIARTTPRRDGPAPFYGYDRLPGPHERVGGGIVKFQRLAAALPNEPRAFNLVYLGSGSLPRDAAVLLRLARRRAAPVVWNQNGVAYPAVYGSAWRAVNAPIARGLQAAAHVFYQSEFCKLTADRFAVPARGRWEILYNAVDTRVFTPAGGQRPRRPLTLLLGGTQQAPYRLETALETVERLGEARLLVTGALVWRGHPGIERLLERLGERVELVGPYAQAEAPALYRRADLLLHTQVNDACPGLVVEAMACGLPVVHPANGGVPELVGPDAGVGIEAELDFDEIRPPDPDRLAEAVLSVSERLDDHAAAARRRAVERFDLAPWVRRHVEVFEELLA